MKRLLGYLLATLLLLSVASSAFAYDFSAVSNGKTLYYNITSSSSPYQVEVTQGSSSSYSSLSGSLTIPSSVTYNGITYSVTSIGNYAFAECSGLTSVTIPNSVTSIGRAAFYDCSGLTTVNFNATNCTSMGGFYDDYYYFAFKDCTSLSTLNIGENVTNIPENAFSGCSGLTTVNYNATNCAQFGSNNGISGNTNITTLSIGGNVETIPNSAFSGCNGLTGALTIPNSVTSIGGRAFYNCSGLTSVTLPNSVTSIGNYAFYGCSGLTSPVYNANCFAYFPCGYATTYTIPNGIQQIAGGAFYNCTDLTSVTIPNSVTSIGQEAFCYCSGLTSVAIGNSVRSIGNYAFAGCSGLTEITIGNSVTSIGNYAFYNCSGLTSVTIGNSVESIGYYAFYGCSGLASVSIGSGVTSIGNCAFYNCSGLTTVNFNATNCTTMGSSSYPVFQNCNANAIINIGEGVTTIPDYAFKGLLGNGILVIPSSVTGIGSYAFSGCSGLTGTLTIPNSVTSIGNSAFSGCNGLTTLNFNAENCTGTISGSLFDSNNTLSKITIGENVTTIPNNAFRNCIALDSIISYASNPPVIYGGTFDSQLSLNTPVVVPCGTVANYEEADFWYNFRRIRQAPGCGQTYTLTVLSSNSAWGTVSGGGIYVGGTTATLIATPNEGYRFSNWSDGSTENPHDVVVTADTTYIATFVQGGSSNPTVYNSIEATACGSYTWNDRTYTESGEYQQTFTAANSADSIVTLTLTIHPAPQPQITLYGELDACNPSSVAFATDEYQSYLWCNGATTMITSTSVPGYYYVEVTDENGCSGRSEQVNIGASNALTEAPQISVVGMNSENHNVVAWSALDNVNVNGYNIYREDNVADVYELMASIDASADTYWTDETADPSARAYRYKVTAVDQCGGESPMSDYHKTMHLTINRGIGNAWNLIWSHYEGFNFGTYRIYRGTSPSNMTMIGEVPSNLNSYTDNTATDNTGFYYQVEVVRNSRSRDAEISSRSNIVDNGIFPEYTITVMSANPNRGTVTGGGTYPEGTIVRIEANALDGFVFTSWSDDNTDNPRYITVTENATYIASFDPATGIEENATLEIALYPNPATDILNITSSETISEIEIVNVMGQVVKRIEVNADSVACDVEDLKAGVYVVRIHGTVVSQRKFIKK